MSFSRGIDLSAVDRQPPPSGLGKLSGRAVVEAYATFVAAEMGFARSALLQCRLGDPKKSCQHLHLLVKQAQRQTPVGGAVLILGKPVCHGLWNRNAHIHAHKGSL